MSTPPEAMGTPYRGFGGVGPGPGGNVGGGGGGHIQEDSVMGDPTILFVKPKAISASDKKALYSAGVIVVEVADPQSVKLVKANAELSGSELLIAAVTALQKLGLYSEFGAAVCAAMLKERSK